MLHKLKYITDRLTTRTDIIMILLLSIVFSANLISHSGAPTTYDGPTHITTWHQVAQVLKQQPGLVMWLDNFANYGSPIPQFAHQTTMYLGAFFELFSGSATDAYALVVLMGTAIGSTGVYLLLRNHVDRFPAFIGSIMFTIAPYRILNAYSRGALPEFFAVSLIPWLLYFAHRLYHQPTRKNFLYFTLLVALLPLTHIFIVVIMLPVLLVYGLYLVASTNPSRTSLLWPIIGGILGIGLSMYYLLPLVTETQYFHYSLEANHIKENQFLEINKHFLRESWHPTNETVQGPKPHIVQSGSIEFGILIIALLAGSFYIARRQGRDHALFLALSSVAIIYVLLQLEPAFWVFRNIPFLGNIQHQWRMMAGFSFVVPILAALMLQEKKKLWYLGLVAMLALLFIRLPELNGKNYVNHPNDYYDFIAENLHGNAMTTLWAEQTDRYPVKNKHFDIIEGDGYVTSPHIENSQREYRVTAQTDVRMVDYTFYFPGWQVTTGGGKETIPIEFQDPNYRGVITYKLPKGTHAVTVSYKPTRKRFIASGISLLSLAILGFVVLRSKKLS